MDRILSGIQPSGSVHIGNYLGAIKNWVELQTKAGERLYCIVDLHALTQAPKPEELRENTRAIALTFLAVGLDPAKSILFRQSDVPEHSELAWILGCVTAMGDLSRMTQFKEKADRQALVNLGLFSYPVLMAADILLYRANKIPVGEDQVQHLELTREIVRRFNATYGDTFPEPLPILSSAPRILGLDGTKKMSKSLNNEIGLFESPEEIWKKLSVAMTDPARKRRSDPGEPTKCNVFTLHGFYTDEAKSAELATGCRTAAIGCLDCKKVLSDNMAVSLRPFRERAAELRKKPSTIDEVLADGAKRARKIALETMDLVRKRVGIR